jgi:hypothetical protein
MPARHETSRYAFHVLRVGATIVRKSDNASVYFQPGDDTAHAITQADHCFATAEAWPGENARVFNRWCNEYRACLDATARNQRAQAEA